MNSNHINLEIPIEQKDTTLAIQEFMNKGLESLNNRDYEKSVAFFRYSLERCVENSELKDIVSQNFLIAVRALIDQNLGLRNLEKVNNLTAQISNLKISSNLSNNPDFRGKFADTFKNIGMDFYFARQFEAALFFYRKAISIKPCPSYFVDLTNAVAQTNSVAQLRDYTTEYDTSQLGRHIFISCTPKSGSTFLKNLLVNITEFKDMFSVFAGLQNEHELDLPQIAKFGNINTVTQQHARASEANIQIMQAFEIKPIILVRNIYDSLASLLDFYQKGFTFSTFFNKEEFNAFSVEQQIDLLIEYAMPWYFQFVSSWQRAEKANRINVKWLRYEDLIADKTKTVEDIFSFYDISVPREIINQKIIETEGEGDKNRFNKGVTGRGNLVLNSNQKNRVKSLARHFPSTDFEIIGI